MLPKKIRDRLTPAMISQVEFLIQNDAENKCTKETGMVINFVCEKFPGSVAAMGKAASAIKSLLGDTKSKPEPTYTHSEIISAAITADEAINDKTFFYSDRPNPAVFMYSISSWAKHGDMSERFKEHRERIENKIVSDANNRYKRPKAAENYGLLQRYPADVRERLEKNLEDIINRTKKAYGDEYVERNYIRIVSDFFNEKKIFDPLMRKTPSGETFNVQY